MSQLAQPPSFQDFQDDEIDLREIALTLWNGRRLIVGLTLVAGLVAFVLSAWILPKQYQAVAYVTVSQPAVRFTDGADLSVVPSPPDIKFLPELAETEAILEQVATDPRIAPLFDSNERPSVEDLVEDLKNNLEIKAIGDSHLRFQVTDTDPQRAAAVAAVWAEKVVEWIELNYGFRRIAADISAQVVQAQQNYAKAESDLETFLAQDTASVLRSQLTALQGVYSCLERRKEAANAILQRLGDLEKRLLQSDNPLSLPDALLLASITQDIDSLETCGSPATILQSPSPELFAGIVPSQGLAVIAGLRQSLQQRIADTQLQQEALQKTMLKLQVEIEHLDYQRTEYIRQRDQAKALYTQLTYQQAVIEEVLKQSGAVARVNMPARAPQKPAFPRPLLSTALAALVTAFAMSALVLFRASLTTPPPLTK